MYKYYIEITRRLKAILIIIFIIQVYLFIMVEEIYNFIHNYIFLNRSTFYLEYNNSITVNAIIKSINRYDLNYEIYIDYQFDNTNI